MVSPNRVIYRRRRILVALLGICFLAVLFVIIIGISHIIKHSGHGNSANNNGSDKSTQLPDMTATAAPTEIPTELPTETPEPTSAPVIYNTVAPGASSLPSIYGFRTELMVNGQIVNSFTPDALIEFAHNDDYVHGEGVFSFRGSCFRQNPYYGVASVENGKLEIAWNNATASVPKGEGGNYNGSWTGSGWTGQALLVRWDSETKAIMNMYEGAKLKEDLVEVIYATMDGNIYFFDMETGEATRDKMILGVPFKGAGSLDPRGWPIMYVGQGDHYSSDGKASKAYVISLIDCKVIATIGAKPDSFALRSWHAYDSAAVIDEATDTLFYPGENGILYRVKLNTVYDKANGTLSMNPDQPVKLRYSANRTVNDGYWLGYESSAVAWRNYIYLCDNAGFLQCIDVNTMQTVWVQDILDDTNCTPALEEDPENGTAYLYVGCSLDNKADSSGYGTVAFFKIDACTGEIVWQKDHSVYTTSGITGGIMSSPIIGQGNISNLVITTVASYGNGNSGTMLAYDRKTGELVWSFKMNGYSWSSPVALYDDAGNAYIVQCNCTGNIYVINGNGNELDCINVESNIEASPVAFDNYIIIGTRVKGIFGIRIF